MPTEDDPYILSLKNELAKLQAVVDRYEPVHQSLRWYLKAQGVNDEEMAVASQQVLSRFRMAEKAAKEAE